MHEEKLNKNIKLSQETEIISGPNSEFGANKTEP